MLKNFGVNGDFVIDQYFFSLKDIYKIYHDVREVKECAYKIHELNCRKAIGDFCSNHPDCVDNVYSIIHYLKQFEQ